MLKFFSLRFIYFNFTCLGICLHVCLVQNMHEVLEEIMRGCAVLLELELQSCMCWELNPDSLEEQLVLLTTESLSASLLPILREPLLYPRLASSLPLCRLDWS